MTEPLRLLLAVDRRAEEPGSDYRLRQEYQFRYSEIYRRLSTYLEAVQDAYYKRCPGLDRKRTGCSGAASGAAQTEPAVGEGRTTKFS